MEERCLVGRLPLRCGGGLLLGNGACEGIGTLACGMA